MNNNTLTTNANVTQYGS